MFLFGTKMFRFLLVLITSVSFANCLLANETESIDQILNNSKVVEFIEEYFQDSSVYYTLFGSKPMSSVLICTVPVNEYLKMHEHMISTFSEENQIKCRKAIATYDLPQKWSNWIALQAKLPTSAFLFRTMPISSHTISADIINIRQVLWIIEENYSTFERELQFSFDPFKVTQEFTDLNSKFWKEVFKNHYLMGILYGYGKRNAFFFSHYLASDNEMRKSPIFLSSTHLGTQTDEERMQIPSFRSFVLPLEKDPIVVQYEKERDNIEKQLQGKSFVSEVVKKLYDRSIDFPEAGIEVSASDKKS